MDVKAAAEIVKTALSCVEDARLSIASLGIPQHPAYKNLGKPESYAKACPNPGDQHQLASAYRSLCEAEGELENALTALDCDPMEGRHHDSRAMEGGSPPHR